VIQGDATLAEGDPEKPIATNSEGELEVTVKLWSGTAAGGLACVNTLAFSHFNI